MTYKIIGDSCLDLTDELKKDARFQMVPLTLQVDDAQVIDDETFDQKSFLELVKNGKECPKTACPSPEKFKEAFECGAENIFVITLSSHLSGTYNAAVVGKELYEEEHGKDKNIAVVDSLSASSGRLTGLQAFFATTLNIKPIMAGDKGVIVKLEQARGMNKALSRMADIAVSRGGDTKNKRLIIAHCNNRDRAEQVKELLCSRASFGEIVITDTAGVATVYAGDGGIIVTL